ncbi:hypothetical protein ACO2Q2_16315 [Dyella sp. KRB-257]|uniref:hypothetical protein n=1 Tax=Dyella sp. KRB-257 TaxID=3400915 RepID=UPI003C101853
MTDDILIAGFSSQGDAMAAAQKLFSMGVGRECVLLEVDERGMQPPSSSYAPSTIVDPTVPGQPTTPGERAVNPKETLRKPGSENLRGPELQGCARLSVRPTAACDGDAVTHLLFSAGASRVKRDKGPLPTPNPAMWPTVDMASSTDVERAVAASRGGVSVPTQRSDAKAPDDDNAAREAPAAGDPSALRK